jgi:hypothetical protein
MALRDSLRLSLPVTPRVSLSLTHTHTLSHSMIYNSNFYNLLWTKRVAKQNTTTKRLLCVIGEANVHFDNMALNEQSTSQTDNTAL